MGVGRSPTGDIERLTREPRAAGVDVGGTKILGVTLDGAEIRVPTPLGRAVLDDIVAMVATLAPVEALGVGLAGLVGADGFFHVGPNLPGLVDVPVRDELEARLGIPVVVGNDATVAAWAEHERGAGRGSTDMVLITLGTGIGAGIVAGGQLQQGANGFAGEFGHMVVDPDGPVCPCGRRGCWERFASGSGLGRLAREAVLRGEANGVVALAGGVVDAVRGEHVVAAATGGDPEASLCSSGWPGGSGSGWRTSSNALDPEVVVIGGGLVEVGELLLVPVRRAFSELVMAPAEHGPGAHRRRRARRAAREPSAPPSWRVTPNSDDLLR